MNLSIVIQRRIGRIGTGNVPARVRAVRRPPLTQKTRGDAAGKPSNQDG
ncbi:hypothetical protein [Burkholderia glumae]|uniref:Uncharacterized protein n=1 Tax=Burkholderia glumae TaxID=337 RepID=A0AAQ0BUG2_BURGL|nr:hypothetical protein [Burkholderia glumae]MCM2480946.1 hypothetical protein [Burkholderia glumae]MCM2492367.1 hypothetical protein [Burkholderia glumae]MCM2508915.1 hypothetical protein [Burkholderia glumae]MCM2537380.1 hypothetical protein [Burkholderia glumae]MCM2543365.1 hypothetical protein [Burkholderia glumae]